MPYHDSMSVGGHLEKYDENAIPHNASPWQLTLVLEAACSYPAPLLSLHVSTIVRMKEACAKIEWNSTRKIYQRGKALVGMASKHREATMCAGIRCRQGLAKGVHHWSGWLSWCLFFFH